MRLSVLIISCFTFCSSLVLAQSGVIGTPKIKGHPRLLLPAGEEQRIKKNIAANTEWEKTHQAIMAECDEILTKPVLERKMIGRRMLSTSREALRRIFFLSYAWRISGDKKYFDKCEQEMLSVAKFSDWNPSHFLDVGEMSLALSIGYDWLYNNLSVQSRDIISKALIANGINPSFQEDSKDNWWLKGTNNWNQVCNTGVAFAAAAIYELQPELATRIIERGIKSIQISMKVYAPDGNYPEGYGYWAYGTSYNVFMISMLEQMFGSDYGLSQLPGFSKTPAFFEHMLGPFARPFNYSDCGVGAEGLQPAGFWFAEKFKNPSLLWQEKQHMLKGRYMAKSNRLLPAVMIWGRNTDIGNITPPQEKTWVGYGENPVAVMRSDWKSTWDLFVGFKGGTPGISHAHMDIGSFVMDALGVRWSADLGMQNYESLESKGLKIWDMKQDSDRWKVFRYTNRAHSTLTVNNQLQQMNGKAPIIKQGSDSMFMYAVVDMGQLYAGQLTSARRGIAIVDKKYVNVRDEIETGDSSCTIRWTMVTPATVAGINKNQMQLTQNENKKLSLYVLGLPEDAVLQSWPATGPNSYDAENTGYTLVGFEVTLPPHTKKAFDVLLLPGQGQLSLKKSSIKALNEW